MQLQPNEELLVLPDAAAAAKAGADVVVQILSHTEGRKSVALSGGRTPAAMHRLLTQPPLRECVDWHTIDWFWGDERCVPPDHADSNYRMAGETLLDPLGIAEDRIHRMPADAADLGRAARDYEATIRRIVPADSAAGALTGGKSMPPTHDPDISDTRTVPAFDLILLGIGADGHTASLFPGSPGLHERQHLVVAHKVPSVGSRMSMTYPLLWAARHIVFLACGQDKAEAMRRILTEAVSPGAPGHIALSAAAPPAAAVRAGRGRITWILDTEAGRLLPAQRV